MPPTDLSDVRITLCDNLVFFFLILEGFALRRTTQAATAFLPQEIRSQIS